VPYRLNLLPRLLGYLLRDDAFVIPASMSMS
jgi:hypothetical protein